MITATRTLDGRWLVAGEDSTGTDGVTLLSSEPWNKLLEYHEFAEKTEVFDEAVLEFFKPLLSAVENLATPEDDWASVTIEEPCEGKPGVAFTLDKDGVLLRLIEESDQATLRWVGGELIALA